MGHEIGWMLLMVIAILLGGWIMRRSNTVLGGILGGAQIIAAATSLTNHALKLI